MTLRGPIIYSSVKGNFPVTIRITVCILFTAVVSHLLQAPRAVRGAGSITEHPIPTASIGRATEITTGADGNLWFLESTAPDDEFAFGQIHRMTIQEPISFTSISVPGSRLSGITSGPFGEILFAEADRNKVGRIFPTFGQTQPRLEEIDLLPGSGQPLGVATLDNAIWFTSFSTGQIGRIALGEERAITYFNIETPFSRPSAITIGPDNKSLYFIIIVSNEESDTSRIGRATLDGAITEFPIPDAGSRPNAITAGPDGNIWFTDPALNSIWRLTPEGNFSSFTIGAGGSEPSGIVAGPDGNLYFTEFKAGRIGVITTGGVIKDEIPIPTQDSGPSGITVGSDGNIWFIEAGASKVGRLELAADLGLSVTTSHTSAGKDQDITLTINITNQGPDSVANAAVSLGKLLPYYSVISCDAAAAGGVCLRIDDDEVPDYLIRVPFIPNGGSITATVVVRITNCSVSSGATALPEISSAISVSSGVPDRNSENNNRVVTINTSPPAKITALDGSAEIRLGPVTPGVSPDPNAPAVIFRLENTGCAALELTVDSLRRIPLASVPNTTCPQNSPAIGNDFRFFEIREIELASGPASAGQTLQLGQPLRGGMRLRAIPPGASLMLSAQFKAQLPDFAGDNTLTTDQLLPDEIRALFTLNQPQIATETSFAAAQVPAGPPTTVTIKGFVSPVAQIVPRDSGSLVQMTTSGDKFEVRFSAFDARLNVRRATYQFFDQYRAPVLSPISVSLENAICQKGITSGQSFTVVTRFSGATTYPEIAHVRVTVFDDEGDSTADSFPNFFSASQRSSAAARRVPDRDSANNFTAVSPALVPLPPRQTKPRGIRPERKQ